ncbi:fasciclin domain-containing protein [Adhaeribacter radiodurans]|uniref:Fasciclin domain-containing protein n=1 Tax=Adhaeribacter radiodurans TaxID=2745197 RepID=A0A7L7L5Z7_9BACT|nr:fasciclin domain-containing protein [Adhaeribacter radiodurans]QMU27945.1 fasciclin domain-containing protein [Adhaeribacter radiodurans]
MKLVFIFCLIVVLAGSCQLKGQVEESREISGVSSETSDIIIADSAAKQTKGVRVGGAWIVPNHVLLENISEPTNIRKFNKVLQGTYLREIIAGKGPFTLFIPTDAAFKKLPPGLQQELFSTSENEQRLDFIKLHIVPGKIVASDLTNEVVLKAGNGHNLHVQNKKGIIHVDDASIIVKDGVSNNGVVHIIDRVLVEENQH